MQNMVYNIISALCIATMLAYVVYLIVKFCRCNRAEKIEFIKNFKKGKCAVIYVVALPLYFIANLFAEKTVVASVFEAISKSVQLVVLKFDVSYALIKQNSVFAAAIYLCLSLVTVNAMMITVSVLHQGLWKKFRLFKFTRAKKNKCIIVGNNAKGLSVYGSCNCPALLTDAMRKEDCERLYIKGVSYQSFNGEDRLYDWLCKLLKKEIKLLRGTDYKVNIIVNCEKEQDNLNWCRRFLQFVESADADVAEDMEIYVFGDGDFESLYFKYEEKSRGCLHYVNEYQQIAIDFIDRFPLTEYMDERHIDFETSLIKKGTDINVALVGFGKTNQQIFLSMVANNQFLTKDEKGNVVNKDVKYHLFDKLYTKGNKNLTRGYFNYKNEFFDASNAVKVDLDDYLPLPPFPATEEYLPLNVDDANFCADLEASLCFDNQSLNYVIVSLGADYASIELANKIVERLKGRNVGNTRVFVRIHDDAILKGSNVFWNSDVCIPFGSNKGVVYDYSHIVREKFTRMAVMRNFIYDIERDMKHDSVTKEEEKQSQKKWYAKRSVIERESNVYACLSLRGKLQLMGLDCRKAQYYDGEGISEEEFFAVYAKGDQPDFVRDVDGNAVAVRYGDLSYKPSLRKYMAEQEHSRWNAFMLTKGFVPSDKDRILKEVNENGEHTNGKDYSARRHGNLTTFDGLVEFRKMVAKRDGVSEQERDVIKYDYQLMDGAWWLLNKNGYKIIKRTK